MSRSARTSDIIQADGLFVNDYFFISDASKPGYPADRVLSALAAAAPRVPAAGLLAARAAGNSTYSLAVAAAGQVSAAAYA